jgi:hypothetical protein
MLTGKRFRIKTATLALDETTAERTSVTIPAGSIIDVIDGPKPDIPLMHVFWEKRWLLMYEQDLRKRAEELTADTPLPS